MSKTKRDKDRVSSHNEKDQSELYYLCEKYNLKPDQVRAVIKQLEEERLADKTWVVSREKIVERLIDEGLITGEQSA